jgi:hypothetical protein
MCWQDLELLHGEIQRDTKNLKATSPRCVQG